MIEINAPDGSIAQFPDGTADDVIVRVMRQSFPQAQAQQPQAAEQQFGTIRQALRDRVLGAAPTSIPLETLPDQALPAVTDIPKEIGGAASEAARGISGLNPLGRNVKPGISDFGGTLEQYKSVGRGLASIPELLSSPITGAARSLGGHLYSGVTGIPYEQSKEAIDTAMMAAAPKGVGLKGARTTLPEMPTTAELKTSARAAYKSPEVTSLRIDPDSTISLANTIKSDLMGEGFRPVQTQGAKTFSLVDELLPKKGTTEVKVSDIDSVRKALNEAAKETNNFGQPTSEAAAARMAINQIDDYLPNLSRADVLAGDASAAIETLKRARQDWGAYARARGVEFQFTRAERQAARSGMGANVENAYRQKVSSILDNPRRTAGWSKEEINAAEKLVRGTPARDALRTVGKLGVDGGLSLLLHAGTAASTGGLNIPVAVIGTLARLWGQRLTAKEATNLSKLIRSRSEMAGQRQPVAIPLPNAALGAVYPGIFSTGIIPRQLVPDEQK